MPVTSSVGYNGTLGESQLAQMGRFVGAEYGVGGPHDCEVSSTTGDRAVRVSSGIGFGGFVMDTVAAETISLDPVTTGSRWDLIVLRRDWTPSGTPGGVTTIQVVKGVASTTGLKVVPAGKKRGFGVVDDQPLALVQVIAGQLPVGIIEDARLWPNKEMVAAKSTALDLFYPDAPFGALAYVPGQRAFWRRESPTGGAVTWARQREPLAGVDILTQGQMVTYETGWTGASVTNRMVRDGNTRQVKLEARRLGARIVPDSNGSLADVVIGNVIIDSPRFTEVPFAFKYGGGPTASSYSTYLGLGTLQAGGAIVLNWLSPNAAINPRPSGDLTWGFRANIVYVLEPTDNA